MFSTSTDAPFPLMTLASRFEADGTWERTVAYLSNAERDFTTQTDRMVRALMFWQLQLTFGNDFYVRMATRLSAMPMADRPTSGKAKRDLFVLEASRVSGHDLIPFFTRWGVPVSADVQARIQALTLKKLTQPIWRNRDKRVAHKLH